VWNSSEPDAFRPPPISTGRALRALEGSLSVDSVMAIQSSHTVLRRPEEYRELRCARAMPGGGMWGGRLVKERSRLLPGVGCVHSKFTF
jgi:hypothetical protein